MNTTKLSDAELNKAIHELLGYCWHEAYKFTEHKPPCCRICGKERHDGDNPDYANSYDAIIKIIQGWEPCGMERLDLDLYIDSQPEMVKVVGREDLYTDAMLLTPRQLAESIYEVIKKEGTK